MAELVADVEDWSLQAIVRGSSGDFAKMNVDMGFDGQDPFSDMLTSFPDMFDLSTGSSDELEGLYKPFYTASQNNTYELPNQTVIEFQGQAKPDGSGEEANYKPAHDDLYSDQSSGNSFVAGAAAGYTPKYKKRKNQHKRVVIQVTAEGLSADKWAWRKYGQKPIKGSPYPRSYYRCSSSKGCLARKQVEQSCNDPGLFIVTYTAEHSHSQPTRRNSLAGTIRQKFPSHNKNLKAATTKTAPPQKTEESCVSPQTPRQLLSDPSAIGFCASIKEENEAEDNDMRVVKSESGGGYSNDIDMSDFALDEDFFSGFEDFDDGFTNPEPQYFPVREECGWF
ncbi:WRKY DNA-binding protein 27 [Striga asiatica]|uniref:WRKY DNA-binding protein 27 n=1 Tax=Striga asiatica TaxID=4170 RepID=A0A5A7PK87_STRAF|nr:WRKY DNA-binding protein 27 [Striga asiatica]